MKIVQITDLHIANDDDRTFDVDVRRNFRDILKKTRELAPDLIVLTGDLCYDTGNADIYRWIKTQMDFVKIPYTVIAGNHDQPDLLAAEFDVDYLLVGKELYYRRDIDGHAVLFLETSSGEVSQAQLQWLEIELSRLQGDTVIFMHHPPLTGGVPYMDHHYALRNRQELQELLFTFPHHLTIFCGHYHVEKSLCIRNLTVHITPSTYFQIDCHSESFKVDHYQIGLREINLRKDKVVESTVLYLEGNKKSIPV